MSSRLKQCSVLSASVVHGLRIVAVGVLLLSVSLFVNGNLSTTPAHAQTAVPGAPIEFMPESVDSSGVSTVPNQVWVSWAPGAGATFQQMAYRLSTQTTYTVINVGNHGEYGLQAL